MTYEFKYLRQLKFLELGYYSAAKPEFDKILNQFLAYYKLNTIDEQNLNFKDNMNHLNSISPIMVDKFVCVMYNYYNKKVDYNDFECFDDSVFNNHASKKEYNRCIFKIRISKKIYKIHLNKENIFYCSNYRPFSISSIVGFFKKTPTNQDPSKFINTKNLAELLDNECDCSSKDEEKALQRNLKKVIGKRIENNDILCYDMAANNRRYFQCILT